MRNKTELRQLRQAIYFWNASIVRVSEAISARASYLVEEHALADSLYMADALIAATTLEMGVPLLTGNIKHYGQIKGIELERFKS